MRKQRGLKGLPGSVGVAAILLASACSSPQDVQLETEKLLNQKRVDVLQKGKDSLTQPREVIFWAKFKTTAELPCFETWLQTHQYVVSYKNQRKEETYPEFVEFSKSMIPTVATMNAVTAELIAAATVCKGLYHEWEAPVVP